MSFPFACYYAKPGNYKSLYFAILIKKNFERNYDFYIQQIKQYYKDLEFYQKRMHKVYLDRAIGMNSIDPKPPEYPKKRIIAVNMKLAPHVQEQMGDFLFYWSDMEQLITLKDADVYIDEIAEFMDSREYELMARSVRRWLSQYRRHGICIYGNTQHWSMIDKRARLMFSEVYKMVKFIGNRDPSPTLPPIKKIWGIGFRWVVTNFESEDDTKMSVQFPPKLFTVNREIIEMYDTREIVKNKEYPPLKHIVRKCEHHDSDDPNHVCNFTKVIHM
jgi:hypothetical protein